MVKRRRLPDLKIMSKRNEVILAVGAHQDDIDFIASGSIAKWIGEGAVVYYLLCTNGNKGSDDPKMTSAKLAKTSPAKRQACSSLQGNCAKTDEQLTGFRC